MSDERDNYRLIWSASVMARLARDPHPVGCACRACSDLWDEIEASKQGEPPYGPMCRDPQLCAGKGYCPRDPSCGE